MNGKRYLASIAMQAITQGRITLANGKVLEISPEDMMTFWKFVYQQVDGPPPQDIKHSGDEEGVPIKVEFSYAGDDDQTDKQAD